VLRRLRASPHLEICGIVRSSRVLDPRFGFLQGALVQIRRSGLRYAAYLFLATSVADLLRGLSGARPAPLAVQAAARGIPVLETRDINAAHGLDFLGRCAPQLLVSAYFNQRVGARILAQPPLGCVNVHPSVLPHLRGVDPVFYAWLRGEPELGVSVHRMSLAFDQGAILAQARVPLPGQPSVALATALLYRRGTELLLEAIDQVAAGAPGRAQEGAGEYDSWPDRAQVRALRLRGVALIRARDLR